MHAPLLGQLARNGTRVATLAVVATVALAPTAHADQASFLADAENEGAFGQVAPVVLMATGRSACDYLAKQQGRYVSIYEQGIVNEDGVQFEDAVKLVSLAERDLCPDAVGSSSAQSDAAAASRSDQNFIKSVTDLGLSGRTDQLINTAHTICAQISAGISGADEAVEIHNAEPQRFSQDQANRYVAAAEANYCPANQGR